MSTAIPSEQSRIEPQAGLQEGVGKSAEITVQGKKHRIGKVIPTPLANIAKRARALGLDLLALGTLLSTQFISLKGVCDPKTSDDPNIDPHKPIVLMIHGFIGRSNHWIFHRHNLVNAGVKNVFTVDLGSPFHSVEEYAAVVDKRIQEIKALTGRDDVIFVCHSMGGLVADAYKKLYAEKSGTKILDTITIGTPLVGTRVAYLAALFSKAARQMLPSSAFSKTRKMFTTRTFKDENGNKVREVISLDAKGVKTTITMKTVKNSPPQKSYIDETTITESPNNDDPPTKSVGTLHERIFDDGTRESIHHEEKINVQTGKALHIGSTYDTVVPCESAIDLTTDKRDKVEGRDAIRGGGGHGVQLFSKEVFKTILNRIEHDIAEAKIAGEEERLKKPTIEVNLELEEPENQNIDTV